MPKKDNYYNLNCVRCTVCHTLLISEKENELETCLCKQVKIGGGLSYGLQRFSKRDGIYEELSIYNNGYAVPQNHNYSLPLTALDKVIYGKWFVQEMRESSHWFDRFDKQGQDLYRDVIRFGSDRQYSARGSFSFSPVMGYRLYCNGMPNSPEKLEFHKYFLDKIVPLFIENQGKSRDGFIKILEDEGFQDRTGMAELGQNGWV